jgi:hypothetical protein
VKLSAGWRSQVGAALETLMSTFEERSEFDKVTDSLREFLDLIRGSVVHFVDTGEPRHL